MQEGQRKRWREEGRGVSEGGTKKGKEGERERCEDGQREV